jgi:hypothetical protein
MAALIPPIVAALGQSAERLKPAFEPQQQTYNYTPCLVLDGEVLHCWYCANRTPGQVTDYLCHRTARKRADKWVWSEETVALTPAASRTRWDSRHVCDPEVIAGRFRFNGKDWRYALLYLGCDAERSTHNQIGVAFANSLDGPWTRYPEPVVRYTSDESGGVVGEFLGWPVYRCGGVGQPAAVSLDRAGQLLLFMSVGERVWGEETAEVDLSDMDRGPIVGPRKKIPSSGLRGRSKEAPVNIGNIGVALDERRDRLYMIREDLPPRDGLFPDFIGEYSQIAAASWSSFRRGQVSWEVLGTVDSGCTGWPRNHNPSFARDPYGRLTDPKALTVGISVAEAFATPPPDFRWLWTYRIGLLSFSLSGDPTRER